MRWTEAFREWAGRQWGRELSLEDKDGEEQMSRKELSKEKEAPGVLIQLVSIILCFRLEVRGS